MQSAGKSTREKQRETSYLKYSEEIMCWRKSYLWTIKKLQEEGKSIFYLDETWVNEGHTGLRAPSGKGRRLIVTHIGSDRGFVMVAYCYLNEKSGDYHEDMNADVFEEHIIQLLDLIPAGSVIVLDNASYHSRQVENLSTTSWRKQDIINWLIQKNITFNNVEKRTVVNCQSKLKFPEEI
ncbi:uncharacterized protein LOC130894889 [Diorhabda carinulata]|uniref:uncharacterized protein LOC130894889 n=1 Tax=Diorhabda carinulata TaxID=1163345 RepID=UPI0025A1693D|nr:uncharacterized protein LOC130894889 [Diorhabda carinulata]